MEVLRYIIYYMRNVKEPVIRLLTCGVEKMKRSSIERVELLDLDRMGLISTSRISFIKMESEQNFDSIKQKVRDVG